MTKQITTLIATFIGISTMGSPVSTSNLTGMANQINELAYTQVYKATGYDISAAGLNESMSEFTTMLNEFSQY